jgi:DNA-directed RNA polymerase subunit omega
VVIAAKRARQINAYYHSLSEGAYGEYTPPMVDTTDRNYLTIALEELAAGKLKYDYKA